MVTVSVRLWGITPMTQAGKSAGRCRNRASLRKDLPIIVLGHSMGSFIARAHAATAPKIAALILLGSNQQHPALFMQGVRWRGY